MARESDGILTEKHGRVFSIALNCPGKLNVLDTDMMTSLVDIFEEADQLAGVGCFLLSGSDKIFSAGVDIEEMKNKEFSDVFHNDYAASLNRIAKIRKPIVAAVSGPALGGGCELVLMCDIILAAEEALFGQPEIGLGLIPGGGGTQRLARFAGKFRAMDMCLTGRTINATEAEQAGLVSRVTSNKELFRAALSIAETIAAMPAIAVMAIKEAVKSAFEGPLSEGLLLERRLFHALFATKDRQEGLEAFSQKRPARFIHR